MIWYEINFLNLIIFFSEIYSKVSQNAMVLAKPAIIHFGGFEVDKKHVQSLQIVNASTEVINMHIIPPQTKYFYIKYKKTVRIKDWIPMLSNFQHTSLKWGGGIFTQFCSVYFALFPLHIICTDWNWYNFCQRFDNLWFCWGENILSSQSYLRTLNVFQNVFFSILKSVLFPIQERLVPGLTIDCTIEFSPDEWRYYYDSIRINCPVSINITASNLDQFIFLSYNSRISKSRCFVAMHLLCNIQTSEIL